MKKGKSTKPMGSVRERGMKLLKHLYYAAVVIYLPVLVTASLLMHFMFGSGGIMDSPYLFELFVLFLYSFPFYLAFIEICTEVVRLFDKKDRTRNEKILNAASALVAIVIIATLINIHSFIYVSVGLAFLLAILWGIGAAVFKRKIVNADFFKEKSFWISAVALFVAAVTVFIIFTYSSDRKNTPDDLAALQYYTDIR